MTYGDVAPKKPSIPGIRNSKL